MSLGREAARNLATTTKTVPQMQGISSRWLLKILPWVQVSGGTYRVNRRLSYPVGDGRVSFVVNGVRLKVIPQSLRELRLLSGLGEEAVLNSLADQFSQREVPSGETIVEAGQSADQIFLLAHGKAHKLAPGKYGDQAVLAVLGDGDHFGSHALLDPQATWEYTVKTLTGCTVFSLTRQQFEERQRQSAALAAQVEAYRNQPKPEKNKHGEAEVAIAAGHEGEPELPGTFVDYETDPREYPLSVAQTVLRVHTRVADLYNDPMNQVEQQLRLTIEELRERQEYEMINHREFGLLHNADLRQRIPTRTGPPTPDDLDELLATAKEPEYFLAHPRTIAAFGRECNRLGLYPQGKEMNGNMMPSWRGVPILSCNKIPITPERTSTILALRTGEAKQGVVGLHQTGIPDEYQPSLNVRFMGINEQAIMSYLVSVYFSVAVLVPDALAMLEHVEIGRLHDN